MFRVSQDDLIEVPEGGGGTLPWEASRTFESCR
jgi:hypothetical protein